MSGNSHIIVGKIIGVHGVRGELVLRSHTEDQEAIFNYPLLDPDHMPVTLARVGAKKKGFIVRIDGINSREEAETLIGCELFTPRDALPSVNEGEYYIEDLIGCQVLSSDGAQFGSIKAMHNFGAGDVMDITKPDGKSEMLLFNDDMVEQVSVAEKTITLKPINVVMDQ